ncbi:MAK10-like protein [Tanacetum coccineum]
MYFCNHHDTLHGLHLKMQLVQNRNPSNTIVTCYKSVSGTSLRYQASNWLERLPAGSITTWEDLTTRFLAQFFPPGRTAKFRNDFLMFQQHHGEYLSKAWTLSPIKLIALPQDVPSTSDRRLIELENQVQHLMEAHLAPTQPNQVNKITTSCEICSGPHDTQYCMEDLEQAFVEYASSRTNKAGDARLSKFEADFKQQQSEMTNKIETVLKAITDRIARALPSNTVKNPKLSTYPVLSASSYPTEDPQCSTQIHGSGYQQKDRKPSQNDKTEHGMEKTVQNQGQNPKMTKSESILKNQQSNRSRN